MSLSLRPTGDEAGADEADVAETFDVILRKIEPHARFMCLLTWASPFLNETFCMVPRSQEDAGVGRLDGDRLPRRTAAGR